jgi:hypothetical protein
MRRISLGIAALALVLAGMSGGVTYALFGADTTTASNITAGTLRLEGTRDNGDRIDGPMFYTTAAEGKTQNDRPGRYPTGPWAPGDEHHRVFQIENIGSLAAVVKTVTATLTDGTSDLAAVLQVRVTTDAAGVNEVAQGTLAQFLAAERPLSPAVPIAPGGIVNLHFFVSMPDTVGNAYQGATLETTFSVYAEQQAHNP